MTTSAAKKYQDLTSKFSSSQARKDQGPNQRLADEVVKHRDVSLLQEIFNFLKEAPSISLGNDAVLTLTAISRLAPEMLEPYSKDLLELLKSKSNRQVFGSMIALANIATLIPERLMASLTLILDSMDEGTVVTRDHGFSILLALYEKDASGDLKDLIAEQVLKSPPNQLGQYTEKWIEVIRKEDKDQLIKILEVRMSELESDRHIKRLKKNLMKLRK